MALVNVSGQKAAEKVPDSEIRKANAEALALSLDSMGQEELLNLRTEVDRRLPIRSLKDLDLEKELVLQLVALQQLQNNVLLDQDTPANQRSQCASALSNAIVSVSKLQNEVHTSERAKRFEVAVISMVNKMESDKAKRRFFDELERMLEAV